MKDQDKKNGYPRLELRPLSSLKAHPDSVRRADAEDEYRLRKSAGHFGLLRPPFVVNDRTGTLLDGDRMLAALRAAGVEQAPVWVVNLPEEDEDAAHLALQNHVGQWLWEPVSGLLKGVQARGLDVGLTGFHDSDTGPLLAAEWKKPEVGPIDGADPRQEALL